MKKLPQISEGEFEVMKVIWRKAPVSTTEVTDELTRVTSLSPKTIQTMLKRLVTKGALTYHKEGRVFIYSPLIDEKEYLDQKSHSFLHRYFHGDLTALVSSYLENDQLSPSDIETLRNMLSKGGK